jgi:hypothetical protein
VGRFLGLSEIDLGMVKLKLSQSLMRSGIGQGMVVELRCQVLR